MPELNYTAPPTGARMMKSESFGRLIAGPVGSGKTVSCIFELFVKACTQDPGTDGLRYTRFAIVRQTLSQLKQTVLKDIRSWLKDVSEYKVSENTIYITAGDVRSEWILIPLENPEDQQRLLSSQLTGAWMSEAIEMDCGLVSALSGRCGRYPYGNLGICSWRGIIADTNMPTEGSDWHTFMVSPPPNWQIFIQPSGLSPEAENLDWLEQNKQTIELPLGHPDRRAQGRKYYERLSQGNNEDWVRRYVEAQYGNDPSGTAVFKASFKRSFHVVDNVEPVSSKLIIVGQDFGRDPCSIITQLDHKGRLLVLEEVIAEDIGLEQHIKMGLRPAIYSERYLGRPIAIVGDPAGANKSTLYEENEFDVLKREGFSAMRAPTNKIEMRIRAVEKFLLEARQGEPGIIIDGSRCPNLVRALDGGYRFGKTRTGQRKPTPDKNAYSHISDALQYACLAAGGGQYDQISGRIMRSGQKRSEMTRRRFSALAWT